MPTTSAKKAFIDSNVLVYAYDADSSHHADAIGFLDAVLRRDDATLSVQNLAELCNVITSKTKGQTDFAKLGVFTSNIRDAFGVVPYTAKSVLASLELSRLHRVHFFDALLAATMLENGVHTIYTENEEDFEKIPGIKAVNPFL